MTYKFNHAGYKYSVKANSETKAMLKLGVYLNLEEGMSLVFDKSDKGWDTYIVM